MVAPTKAAQSALATRQERQVDVDAVRRTIEAADVQKAREMASTRTSRSDWFSWAAITSGVVALGCAAGAVRLWRA